MTRYHLVIYRVPDAHSDTQVPIVDQEFDSDGSPADAQRNADALIEAMTR